MSRTRGTNIFALIGKSFFESTAGRIQWRSNMWALIGSRWDKRRLRNEALIGSRHVNDKGEFEREGRTLVAKPFTLCPFPPADDFYFDGKYHWVPAVECRKCEHHKPSNRTFRFPRCTYKKPQELSAIASSALAQTNELIGKAVDDANRMAGK